MKIIGHTHDDMDINEKCDKCDGLGKLKSTDERDCNCGKGEGCIVHNIAAISIWGLKCEKCKGKGIIK